MPTTGNAAGRVDMWLVSQIARATDASDLVHRVALTLELSPSSDQLRLWALTDDGPREAARFPDARELQSTPITTVLAAATGDSPLIDGDHQFLPLVWDGAPVAVVESRSAREEVASRLGSLASVLAARVAALERTQAGGAAGVALRAAAQDVQHVISAFGAAARRLLDHDRLSVYLLTPDGNALERFGVATSPIIPGEGDVIPIRNVGIASVIRTNEPIVSADFAHDAGIDLQREDALVAGAGFHAVVSVPLRVGGEPFGVMNFVSRTPGFYGDEDIGVAQLIADQVAVFLQHLRLEQAARLAVRSEAVEEERQRLARELRETLARSLTQILAEADALSGERPGAGDRVLAIRQAAERALAEAQRALRGSGPSELDRTTLDEAISAAVERLGRETGVITKITGGYGGLAVRQQVASALFGVFQDAIANVRQHAEARRVTVTMWADDRVNLAVRDDGRGFMPDARPRDRGPAGLERMRERVRQTGGELIVTSTPGEGTEVWASVPLSADAGRRAPAGAATAPRGASGFVRTLVVDDHRVVRTGLKDTLAEGHTLRLVGEASSAREAITVLRLMRPDLVLLAADLEDAPALDLVARLRAESRGVKVVVLSSRPEIDAEAALIAGASGCVRKDITGPALSDAIRTVMRGGSVVGTAERTDAGPRPQGLTKRELEILARLARGDTNSEIGGELHLSTKSVERMVSTIVGKLEAKNRTHAVAKAIARRLVDARDVPGTDRPG